MNFTATYEDGTNAIADLNAFAKIIGLEACAHKRYSHLLLLQLFGSAQSGFLNPAKVVSQIRVLEGLEESHGLKAATPFKHPSLKGLWHQHYLEDDLRCFSMNIQKGLGKYGIPYVDAKIAEAVASGEERYFTAEDAAHIANDVVSSNWQRLKNDQAVTGEWLIFAMHKDQKYYLCIGKHDTGDENIRAQIDAICLQEFPFLREVLE